VVEPEPRGERERLPAPRSLSRRQQDLLLDADVAEQAPAELGVGGAVDLTGLGDGAPEQAVEARMILDEVAGEGSWLVAVFGHHAHDESRR